MIRTFICILLFHTRSPDGAFQCSSRYINVRQDVLKINKCHMISANSIEINQYYHLDSNILVCK